ncbi:lipopolysaccharide assembly protein LapB [Inmirania thermothiophila]|uniref:Lipopolysaccharide assembly protein B n=1 Tax=Inmirania thermothiophila TaxID=1750597 RepID=A0A3N1Y8F7_9GAMM|nr:lipopolysaccharide assembly protein LapB [Inmirania thermothiophila]ROR35099.1 lipopolysaccharide biosynthesis regulator YciM [Inmirania thermothiophila]
MLELLWLLLPLAAASGYLAGRRRPPAPPPVSARDYLRGINHLLNDETDKAVELLIRMVEADSETVETHLALASLFRRRGELERAIRIHQNLIARPTLEPAQRTQALLELGRDYLRAGLYDRAEAIFQDLVGDGRVGAEALEQLMAIYEREREWPQAIAAARRLARQGRDQRARIAHYLCELGEEARAAGDLRGAEARAREALAAHRGCTRAALLVADVALARRDPRGALRALREIRREAAAEVAPAVVERLEAAFAMLGDEAGLMRELYALGREPGAEAALLRLAELRRDREGSEAAAALLREALAHRPGLEAAHALLALRADGDPTGEDGRAVAAALARMLAERARYRCRGCGFRARALHWQCPRCKAWGAMRAFTSEEGVDRVQRGVIQP